MKQAFSRNWNASVQPRKQRKFGYHAPLNIKGIFLNAHLSKELRTKYGTRSIRVRKGDSVKVMRGQFKGTSGKVERIALKKTRVYVSGVEFIKKDGTKLLYPLHPSNLMITGLGLDDKKRRKALERTAPSAKERTTGAKSD